MISVIITTLNRHKKLKDCLVSIFKNSYKNFEIILIDQSNNDGTYKVVKKIKSNRIKYQKVNFVGKSKGLNVALTKASGNILAFTDDDCLVDKNWLKEIYKSFKNLKQPGVLTGSSIPYQKNKHLLEYCPATYIRKKTSLIKKPCYHATNIGFGNNMAFRREIFDKIGGFKEWLGPGSVSQAAVDAEFLLRALIYGKQIKYNSKLIIYHNKWLTYYHLQKQMLKYTCGELACYGYYSLQGYKFAHKIVLANFYDSWNKLKYYSKQLIKDRKTSFSEGKYVFLEILYRLRGFMLAFYFIHKEPLRINKLTQ